jgi:hypothetical protein
VLGCGQSHPIRHPIISVQIKVLGSIYILLRKM